MIDISEDERRRAFVTWLRTGALPHVRNDETIERKFNPWHDPVTGRFTFAGTGQYCGGFGGAGATGTWTRPRSKRRPATSRGASTTAARADRLLRSIDPSAQPRHASNAPLLTVVRNGYTYQIDSRERTRHVSGELTVADVTVRSRSVQARAGSHERRVSDDGGHYIAARFNGPTEAFNHFAQDANFNRGGYRSLEDQWAKAKRSGKRVTVRIVPSYAGRSIRPSLIDVWFSIDGHGESIKFPNERAEKPRGRQ